MSIAYYEKLVQEDLDVGVAATTKRNPGGGTLTATQVGIHSFAVGQAKTTTTWDPGSISTGGAEEKNVTVAGAALGDFALASFSLDLAGLQISAAVTAANTVTVTLANTPVYMIDGVAATPAAVDLGSGTLSVIVFKSA